MVQGGSRVGSAEYLQGLRALHAVRALLVVDEVQTGFGRTGRMFACEHQDLVPDLMCGKSIAGGYPYAVSFNHTVETPCTRGSTAHLRRQPSGLAASIAVLDYLERTGLPRQAAEKGHYFRDRLRSINARSIREVRGLGLMVGIECRTKVQPYLQALMEKGVLALPAGSTVLRFLPPLVIELEDLDRVAEAVAEVLA